MIMLVSKCIYHTLGERKNNKFIETIICMYGKPVMKMNYQLLGIGCAILFDSVVPRSCALGSIFIHTRLILDSFPNQPKYHPMQSTITRNKNEMV